MGVEVLAALADPVRRLRQTIADECIKKSGRGTVRVGWRYE
jgi:hypothetical protein